MAKQEDYVWEDIWRVDSYRNPAERARRATKRLSALRAVVGEHRDLGDVVEVGCGDGSLANALFADPTWTIRTYRGLDRSARAINRAKQKCAAFRASQFAVADITELSDYIATADTVIACGIIEHIRNEKEALATLRSICRSSARVLITTSNTYSLMYIDRLVRQALRRWQYGYQKNYSARALDTAMSPCFSIERLQVHHGDWDLPGTAIVDRIASTLFSGIGRYLVVLATPQV